MKILEVRILVPDEAEEIDLEVFGEHLQEYIPAEADECHEGFEVKDVTFEIKKERRLATLTLEQDHRWDTLFAIEANSGTNDDAAASAAWEGMCEEWPELRKFDGCKA